ncbi:YggS family pyridoxal phosphate-dependent enzyme [Scopulibacillus cellulosilyticus]|uniref:Pyridoxal phosphate homeostasis protein n=1 Tax=Scopulibacillus cellulosilyticus TaxID=2665665 RepID=A0ABW2PZ09_9BACL
MTVLDNLEMIQSNIFQACERSNRRTEDVKIIGVTKYVSCERAREAVDAGVLHLGENRKEGLLKKRQAISDDKVNWHFIGSLQSRKVKEVIDYIDFLHSLDRLSLAKEINKRAKKPVQCFVQVNISGEESKHGLQENELEDFVQQLKHFDKIKVIGLMTMAPHIDNEQEIRQIFRRLKEWQTDIQEKKWDHAPCTELSMGMSNDYQIAIEEGATFVRIGTALVGKDE